MTQTWIDPFEGFEYQPWAVSVEAGHQEEKLACCGIDPAVFGPHVDPSFCIGLAIQAGIQSGITAEGNVNMVQRLVQHRPARLGEPVTVKGRIVEVREVPRGRVVTSDAWFEDENGERVISAPRSSLKPDPQAKSKKGAGERPAPVIEDVGVLTRGVPHQLTPEAVCAYSSEGNSIHYDMAAANAGGFRAPIIGGGMGVHYLAAHLWQAGAVTSFAAEIYFRRPIFWDDVVDVRTDGERALALCRDDKIATEMGLRALQR